MKKTLILSNEIEFASAVARMYKEETFSICDPRDFSVYSLIGEERALEGNIQAAMAECKKLYIKLPVAMYDEIVLRRDGFLTSIQEGTQIFDCSPLDDERLALYTQFFSVKNLAYTRISLSNVDNRQN